MMNNIGQPGAADAVTPSKTGITGRKNAEDAGNGFSNALSEIHRDGARHASDDAEDDAQASLPDDGLAQEDVAPAKPKPIIDISKHALRSKPLASAEDGVEAAVPAAAEKMVKVAVQAAPDRQLSASEKKLKEALAAAKAITEKLDTLQGQKPAASGALKAVKTEADEDLDDLEPLDVDALLSKDGDDGKLSDVLSLLNAQSPKTAADAGHAQARPATAGPSAKKASVDATAAPATRTADTDGKHVDRKVAGLGAEESVETEGETAPVAGDRLFRFSSDKSRGQNMDMSVSGNDGQRKAEFKSAGNGAAETVTVLDSRRFIGLAPNSNSAALTAALSGDKEWVSAMQPSSALSNAAAQSSTGSVVNTLKLQMNPHDLGSVTAMLRLQGEQLNVHLTVETRAAYRQLSEDSGSIVDALRSQGFAVDQVTISIAPTADSDTNTSAQQNGQNGGQAMPNDERQGSAAGRGQGQGQGQQAAGREANETTRNLNDAATDNDANTAAGGTRSGQLYL